MKKLHAFAFYALITPAIALGSAALLAEEGGSANKDLGEQDMGHDAKPGNKNSELHQGSTKSKYNAADTTGRTDKTNKTDSKKGDQSGKKKKDDQDK
ncbi:hypothetical protein [Marinobacter sp.]|uniref:hypothetical protein n=1 Tax=Marinobacter sp. TaxID=50741 RepID=UPI003A9351E3